MSRSAGSDANAVIARCRSTGESPSTQSSSVPSSCSSGPVRRPSARAAWTHTSGSGCKQQRLQHLERAPDELRDRSSAGMPAHAHLEAARREHAAAQRAVRGRADHRVEGRAGAEQPAAEVRNLERARARLPDQDLRAARAPRRSPAAPAARRRRGAARRRARRAAALPPRVRPRRPRRARAARPAWPPSRGWAQGECRAARCWRSTTSSSTGALGPANGADSELMSWPGNESSSNALPKASVAASTSSESGRACAPSVRERQRSWTCSSRSGCCVSACSNTARASLACGENMPSLLRCQPRPLWLRLLDSAAKAACQ